MLKIRLNLRKVVAIAICLAVSVTLFAQQQSITVSQPMQKEQKLYLGVGFGFDYGGVGGKIEYLPIKSIGLFGGLGSNFVSLGWNVGATYKILPDKKVSPNLMVMYGYNAALSVKGASEYDKVSYGISVGGNLDIKLGSKGNTMSIGLFVPIRSKEFMDHLDSVKNDPRIKMENDLLPVAFSFGYNFAL